MPTMMQTERDLGEGTKEIDSVVLAVVVVVAGTAGLMVKGGGGLVCVGGNHWYWAEG